MSWSGRVLPVNGWCPGADGGITAAQVTAACREDTVLVSIMLVNNETGARFPLEEIIPAVRRAAPQALIHCDAVQAAGKLPIRVESLDVDLLTISGHKLHAPKGCGALYIKKGIRLLPRALGGEQEEKRRAGTRRPCRSSPHSGRPYRRCRTCGNRTHISAGCSAGCWTA